MTIETLTINIATNKIISEDNLIVIDNNIFILADGYGDGYGDFDNGYKVSKIAIILLSKNIEYNHNLLKEKVKEIFDFIAITYILIFL